MTSYQAITTARALMTDPGSSRGVMWFTYVPAIPYGVLLPDETALRDTSETAVNSRGIG